MIFFRKNATLGISPGVTKRQLFSLGTLMKHKSQTTQVDSSQRDLVRGLVKSENTWTFYFWNPVFGKRRKNDLQPDRGYIGCSQLLWHPRSPNVRPLFLKGQRKTRPKTAEIPKFQPQNSQTFVIWEDEKKRKLEQFVVLP